MRLSPVLLAVAVLGVLPAQETVPGRVRASREIAVSVEVSGRVVGRPVPRSSRVKAGDVVVLVDPTLHRIAVDRARARLAQAEAQARLAAIELERGEDLRRRASIDQSSLDRLRAEQRGAEAAVGIARAALDEAEVLLERTKVRAPIAGLVSEIHPEVGESVASGTPVFELLTVDDLVIETFLTAAQLRGLEVGRPIPVAIDEAGAPRVIGRIRELAGAAGPKRTYRLVVELPEPPPGLRAGFVATVELAGESSRR